ncbi:MAG: cation transporter [bacterium]|nr:cation transporter [bacterium]
MKSDLHRTALRLAYVTVGYNVVEGVVSIAAGTLAGSIALVGFGLDSFVESLSGGVMIWRLRKHGRITPEEEERVEARATRLVGLTFFVLGAYVLYESLGKLLRREIPEPSVLGIAVAAVSLAVMPVLYRMKDRVGRAIGSESLVADSRETLACSFLSAALLAGLGANYLWGAWWADPAVGLVVVAYLVREGSETLRGACRC